MKILVNPFDEAEKLGGQRGKWVVGIIETRIFWPKKKQSIPYCGKDFLLLPFEQQVQGAPSSLPAVALRADVYQLSTEDARKEILWFASALSWREGQKIEVISWSGGNLPRSLGIPRTNAITEYLDDEHLPVPTNEVARNALAFYREGISLDNPFYSFLSFYKAFSIAIPNGRERDTWMTRRRHMLGHEPAKRLAEIEKGGIQVGTYLYEQCRHAVAHSDRKPFVNPDNLDDHFRLTKDIPLMRKFTEIAIEEAFEIKQLSTIYREHLYELEGFREILPPGLMDRLKLDEQIADATELDLPDHYMLMAKRGLEQYPLEKMTLIGGTWTKGGFCLSFQSDAGAVRLRATLNFAKEKLYFDPMEGFDIAQNNNNRQCAQEALAALRFQRCVLSNGHLEIWDANQQKRLGCSEGYMPVNCFVNTEFFDGQIAALSEILLRDSSSTKDCPAS
jgi:hypothetical protein